jgi:hypothetical protein
MPKGVAINPEHCNMCGNVTNHAVLREAERYWEVEEQGISASYRYQIHQCQGCGDVHFLETEWFSEDVGPGGQPVPRKRRYPPAISRRRPVWMDDLEAIIPIHGLLQEVYVALQNGNLRLCALGVRAGLEQIMVERVGDNRSLGRNIDAFLAAGYVAPRDHDQFRRSVIEIGNAAMHRGYCPSINDVNTLLDITENLIESIYIHPHNAEEMGRRIPQRGPLRRGG